MVPGLASTFRTGDIKLERHISRSHESVVDPFANQQTRVSDMAWGLLEHSGEHYGQLVVYYRVAGLVPPESRPKK